MITHAALSNSGTNILSEDQVLGGLNIFRGVVEFRMVLCRLRNECPLNPSTGEPLFRDPRPIID